MLIQNDGHASFLYIHPRTYKDNISSGVSTKVFAPLTSSLRTPKIFVKEFSYFLMPCHQHGLGVNLLVQR